MSRVAYVKKYAYRNLGKNRLYNVYSTYKEKNQIDNNKIFK